MKTRAASPRLVFFAIGAIASIWFAGLRVKCKTKGVKRKVQGVNYYILHLALYICLVTPKGLEPPTNRTGICHSIQLNYGAGMKYE